MEDKTPFAKYFKTAKEQDPLLQQVLKGHGASRFARPSKSSSFKGPNQRAIFQYQSCDAIIIFKRRKSEAGYIGMQCVLFINNSSQNNVELIRDATNWMTLGWGDLNKFVYLDSRFIADKTGDDFLAAGWKIRGRNPIGQTIMEFAAVSDEEYSRLLKLWS